MINPDDKECDKTYPIYLSFSFNYFILCQLQIARNSFYGPIFSTDLKKS
jgi:hypothetical protein